MKIEKLREANEVHKRIEEIKNKLSKINNVKQKLNSVSSYYLEIQGQYDSDNLPTCYTYSQELIIEITQIMEKYYSLKLEKLEQEFENI